MIRTIIVFGRAYGVVSFVISLQLQLLVHESRSVNLFGRVKTAHYEQDECECQFCAYLLN